MNLVLFYFIAIIFYNKLTVVDCYIAVFSTIKKLFPRSLFIAEDEFKRIQEVTEADQINKAPLS